LGRELLDLLVEDAKPSTCIILANARKGLKIRISLEGPAGQRTPKKTRIDVGEARRRLCSRGSNDPREAGLLYFSSDSEEPVPILERIALVKGTAHT